MCGINGLADIKRALSKEEMLTKITAMNDRIIHRGPDSSGVLLHRNTALGMRRLSVIDIEGGDQPIFNEDKTLALVLNGEIYNYRELREKLIGLGHEFITNSDSEVVLHAFEEYGEKCAEQFDGMFAFCIFNMQNGDMFICRDRAGEKPLYYYADDDFFIFASELKSILAAGIVVKEINRTALRQFLCLTYIPAPLTIFEKVFKLGAGEYIKFCGGRIKKGCWYELRTGSVCAGRSECREMLRKTLFASVENRMIADVPVGSFLSGGIDSTIITGIMAKLSGKSVDTFTIGFAEKDYDERGRAKLASEFHRTNHHVLEFGRDGAAEIMETVINNIDEPFADTSQLSTYMVSKMASEHVKVVLTGDAGDELFAGYSKYLINYYADMYNRIPKILRKNIFERALAAAPDKSRFSRKLNKVVRSAQKDRNGRRLDMMSRGFKYEELGSLLKNDCGGMPIDTEKLLAGCNTEDEIARTLYLDFKVVLEGDMLAKVDRCSMLASVETRTPMLSKDMIELAFRIPSEYKINKREQKIILKETFADLLPPALEKAPKRGFDVPIDRWLAGELKSELTELTGKSFIEEQGLFEYDCLKTIIAEHFSGVRNRREELWSIYIFQKWYKNYFLQKTRL